jgi:hypothetical protein
VNLFAVQWRLTLTAKPISSFDESGLRRFAGTYLLYEGVLFRFKYERGNLFHIAGKEKLRLDPYSENEFTQGSRRYKFLLSENGQPKGVLISDSYYDPQTAENSAIYLPMNNSPGATHTAQTNPHGGSMQANTPVHSSVVAARLKSRWRTAIYT